MTPAQPEDVRASWHMEEIPGCVHGCKGACPNCDVTQKRQFETGQFCGLLRDPKGPFRDCLATVDPAGYFEDCVPKGRRDVLCQAITAYTSACRVARVKVYSWRTAQFCAVKCLSH
uniref:VWF/SSPO/Zonadhesin-like cysteine-rich domain-containing protein n=1 Tax=Hucho hucho TaxID=62062 RepID=A0A4W5K3S8_9TELE